MTNIHVFPPHPDGKAVRRLTEKLLAAFKAGEDLGSRAPHIHALAETLERTLIDLDREFESLNATLTPREFDALIRDSGFLDMREKIKKMIEVSRKFPG